MHCRSTEHIYLIWTLFKFEKSFKQTSVKGGVMFLFVVVQVHGAEQHASGTEERLSEIVQ